MNIEELSAAELDRLESKRVNNIYAATQIILKDLREERDEALAERDDALAERDVARAHRTTLWQAVEAARSVFSEDGVRDVVTAFTQYHEFTERVADMDVRGEE